MFALSDEIGHDVLQFYNKQKTLIDLPQSIHFLANIDPTVTASALNQSISHALAFAPWPGIDVSVHSFYTLSDKLIDKFSFINLIYLLVEWKRSQFEEANACRNSRQFNFNVNATACYTNFETK